MPPFDQLPPATQAALIEGYQLESATSWRPMADEHHARQFFRTLDAETLTRWMKP